jgi:hypothetical protein
MVDCILAQVCKDLRMLNEVNLVDGVLCAYAAITGVENPRVDLSYSYIMRKLRKGDIERRKKFQKIFKEAFDRALYEDLDDPSSVALMVSLKGIEFDKERDA